MSVGSDRSDLERDLSSDAADGPSDQDSEETENDESGGFFDLEADESEGYGEEEEEEEDHDDVHYSFPQFSSLPPELRTMIWEAVDPHLKSEGRVLDFDVFAHDRPRVVELWETGTLAGQTAPARALLATNRESRSIALKYYPDAIRLRGGLGEVRFNGSQDIVLLRTSIRSDIFDEHILASWSDKIKYLALDVAFWNFLQTPYAPGEMDKDSTSLEAIFYCMDAYFSKYRELDWSVSQSSKQFYFEMFDERLGMEEAVKLLYCWPGTKLQADVVTRALGHYGALREDWTEINNVPILPMVQYWSDKGMELYRKAKRYYDRSTCREDGSVSPLESSEGESFYESELDDYELDGFVVEGSSEGNEESADEDADVDANSLYSINDHEDSFDGDIDGERSPFDQKLNDFNGFSPLQGHSDDEVIGNLPHAASITNGLDSSESYVSDAPSSEGQPRVAKKSGGHKRHIVSSDDEDASVGGSASIVKPRSRAKRARLVLSESEDEGDGGGGTGSGVEVLSRPKKRARVIVSDSDEEDEDQSREEGHRLPEHNSEESDSDEEGDEETEEGDDDEAGTTKPLSLLARLRQFRSDVPVSPEGESTNSAEEYDEDEHDEDDEGRGLSEAEFPESAGEDGEEDGW